MNSTDCKRLLDAAHNIGSIVRAHIEDVHDTIDGWDSLYRVAEDLEYLGKAIQTLCTEATEAIEETEK